MQASELTDPATVCARAGVSPQPPAADDKIGLSRSARSQTPVYGLRVNPTEGVSGWYVWAGEMSDAEDFFEPSHVLHLPITCPLVLPFLSLPAGWRFLTDGDYVDIWFDPELEL